MIDNRQFRQQQHTRIERLEIMRDGLIDTVSIWGPLFAPAVPAGLTAAAIIASFPELLHIPLWAAVAIAVVTVIALEVLGIVSVETWLDMRQYNQSCADETAKAPERYAAFVVILYALVVIGLVFILKIWKEFALYSLLPLTLLGLITSWTIVLRKQHRMRIYLLEQANEEHSEIDRLNMLVEQLTEHHKAALNSLNAYHAAAIEQQTEQLNTEYQAALSAQIEQLSTRHAADKERLQGQIASLKEKLQRTIEQPEDVQAPELEPAEQPDNDTTDVPRLIVDYVIKHPNCTNQALADALGRSKSTISEHVKWLAEREIIDISKAGTKNILSVNGNAAAFMSGQML